MRIRDPREQYAAKRRALFGVVVAALNEFLAKSGDQLGNIISIDISEEGLLKPHLAARLHLYDVDTVNKLCRTTRRLKSGQVEGWIGKHICVFALDLMAE